jgi:hypothetical protein
VPGRSEFIGKNCGCPERVAGLVLEASPTTLCGHEALDAFVESVVSGLEDPIDPGFARSFVVDTSSKQVAPEMLDLLVAELLKVPARVWREVFAGLLDYDDVDKLGHVTSPTLLIWGDADGLVRRTRRASLRTSPPSSSDRFPPDHLHMQSALHRMGAAVHARNWRRSWSLRSSRSDDLAWYGDAQWRWSWHTHCSRRSFTSPSGDGVR